MLYYKNDEYFQFNFDIYERILDMPKKALIGNFTICNFDEYRPFFVIYPQNFQQNIFLGIE